MDVLGKISELYIYSYTCLNSFSTCLHVFVYFRSRGKMRFWGKAKSGEKKLPRERLFCGGDILDGDCPETSLMVEEGEMR